MPHMDSSFEPVLADFQIFFIVDYSKDEYQQKSIHEKLNRLIELFKKKVEDRALMRVMITFICDSSATVCIAKPGTLGAVQVSSVSSFNSAVQYVYKTLNDNRTHCSGTFILPTIVAIVSGDAATQQQSITTEYNREHYFKLIRKWVLLQNDTAQRDYYVGVTGNNESVVSFRQFEENEAIVDAICMMVDMEQDCIS